MASNLFPPEVVAMIQNGMAGNHMYPPQVQEIAERMKQAGQGGPIQNVPAMNPQAMGVQNPFQNPEPAPSPALGFQAWASDPRNAMKVTHSMTEPTAPLQPNAGANGMPAPAATPSAAPPGHMNIPPGHMASWYPPPIHNAAAGANAQAAANPQGGMPQAGMPQASAAPAAMPPAQSAAQAQLTAAQAEQQRLQQSGAAANHIHNGLVRTLAQVGDIAAPFLLGSGAMAIPGTAAHNLWLQQQQGGRVEAAQQNLQNQQQQVQGQAELRLTNAQADAVPINTQLKKLQAQGGLAQHGLMLTTDDQGNSTGVAPDPNSPVYQQQQAKEGLIEAQTQAYKANVELRNAQAAFDQAKMNPNSPLFVQTQQRLATAQENAQAATRRSEAYMGNYLQGAFGTDMSGQALPGATQITDDQGQTTTVGTKSAPQATKSQANLAQLNDVFGATENIEGAAKRLVASGGKLNSPAVVAAIADPKTTSGQWAQGLVAGTLTPAERDYVIQVKAYRENLQGLRKSAGGGISDAQVDRLMQTAPGANTPDLDYLLRQTGQIRALRTRLAAGAATAKGGLTVQGGNAAVLPPGPAPAKNAKAAPAGATHTVPGNDGNMHYTDGQRDLGVVQ